MMKDADNPNDITLHVIENAMAAMRQGADRGIDLGPQSAGKGMPPKQIERRLEASQINFRLLETELGDAVVEYRLQIGERGRP